MIHIQGLHLHSTCRDFFSRHSVHFPQESFFVFFQKKCTSFLIRDHTLHTILSVSFLHLIIYVEVVSHVSIQICGVPINVSIPFTVWMICTFLKKNSAIISINGYLDVSRLFVCFCFGFAFSMPCCRKHPHPCNFDPFVLVYL